MSKPHANFETMNEAAAKFQKDQSFKTFESNVIESRK